MLLLPIRNERKVEFTAGIALARLGPMLVKYLQNRLAISTGSVLVLPSALNDDDSGDLRTLSLIYSGTPRRRRAEHHG